MQFIYLFLRLTEGETDVTATSHRRAPGHFETRQKLPSTGRQGNGHRRQHGRALLASGRGRNLPHQLPGHFHRYSVRHFR